MRRAARIDRNQSEIVEALRKLGASVQPLHGAHDGIPDLLVVPGRKLLARSEGRHQTALGEKA